jgi:hypothetical protein
MNEELLSAANVFLFQNGALLVSHNGFINFLAIVQCEANPSLQCTRTQPSYFNNTGGTSKRIMTSILPLKMPTDYKSVPLTLQSQLVLAFTGRNYF